MVVFYRFAPLKKMLRYKLREIMMAVDLDEVTSKYVCTVAGNDLSTVYVTLGRIILVMYYL
jgi:hypothetical protein